MVTSYGYKMRLVLATGCTTAAILLAGGCAAHRVGQGYTDSVPDEIEKLIRKEYAQALCAVGIATGPDEGVAQRKAVIQARSEMARIVQTQVEALQRSYEETVAGTQAHEYQQTIETFATLALQGSQTARSLVRRERSGEWSAKVLMVVTAQDLKEIVDQKTREYTAFRASKAYKELQERVEREKQL